ncbi:MAG: hypothetical protein IAF38_21135 [Bacteroidia bacterium]|nr:hypothetical protein [Bacteroidia bacterium]
MNTSKRKFYKNGLSKFLLAFVLLLSLQGYSSGAQYKQKQIVKTEVAISGSARLVKKVYTYQKLSLPFFSASLFNISLSKVILEFNRVTKIRFDHLSKSNCIVLRKAKIFQIKIIPLSSSEELSIACAG